MGEEALHIFAGKSTFQKVVQMEEMAVVEDM
jgi:hypothetical protein